MLTITLFLGLGLILAPSVSCVITTAVIIHWLHRSDDRAYLYPDHYASEEFKHEAAKQFAQKLKDNPELVSKIISQLS